MSTTIYTKKTWVVYLTIYSGKLLPRRYIGYTYQEKFDTGYNGTVTSKKYKPTYITEQKNNKHLFNSRVLNCFATKKEATRFESEIQKKYNVVKSDDYYNLHDGIDFNCDTSKAVLDPNGVVYKSQRDAAKEYNVTHPTIAYWINNKVGWISMEGDNVSDDDKIKRLEKMKVYRSSVAYKEAKSASMKVKFKYNSRNPDPNIYILVQKDGKPFSGTQLQLKEKYPEHSWSNLSKMLHGQVPSCHGWSLK